MADIAVLNTDSDLSAQTLLTAEGSHTVTGAQTFDRDPNPPFVVTSGSAVVPNLDADKVDGKHSTDIVLADGTTAMTAKLDLGSTGQIQFPATQNASSGANVLDDYEEGTWTPVWTGGSSPTPAIGNGTLTGTYTKIGRLVVAQMSLTGGSTTVWGSSGNGWSFSLPFQAATAQAIGNGIATDTGTAQYPCMSISASGGSTFQLYKTTTAVPGTFTSAEPFAWGTGDVLIVTVVYAAAN